MHTNYICDYMCKIMSERLYTVYCANAPTAIANTTDTNKKIEYCSRETEDTKKNQIETYTHVQAFAAAIEKKPGNDKIVPSYDNGSVANNISL